MNTNKVIANYNMEFNNGSFQKNKIYNYRINPNNSEQILITTEEEKEQELWYTEFDILFTLLKT